MALILGGNGGWCSNKEETEGLPKDIGILPRRFQPDCGVVNVGKWFIHLVFSGKGMVRKPLPYISIIFLGEFCSSISEAR
jgi:hypothetical protein